MLLAVAVRLVDAAAYTVFRCPLGPDLVVQLVRVTVLACPTLPPHHLIAAVVVAPPADVHGLTRRELQILGLIIAGWTNARIAAVLVITSRTVAAHVEHILTELDAETRDLAAVRALGEGLSVPPELTGIRSREGQCAQRRGCRPPLRSPASAGADFMTDLVPLGL